MAFYLKKLTPKQREQFAQKQIENPLSPALGVFHPIGIIRMRNCSFCIGGRGR